MMMMMPQILSLKIAGLLRFSDNTINLMVQWEYLSGQGQQFYFFIKMALRFSAIRRCVSDLSLPSANCTTVNTEGAHCYLLSHRL
jgi:hypothetical protein